MKALALRLLCRDWVDLPMREVIAGAVGVFLAASVLALGVNVRLDGTPIGDEWEATTLAVLIFLLLGQRYVVIGVIGGPIIVEAARAAFGGVL